MQRETLASRLGFLFLSAGCAIGLGNVWRFPYITGVYGGGAFVIMYLIFLIILGLPVIIMEFAVGRASRQNIGGAFRKLEPAGTKCGLDALLFLRNGKGRFKRTFPRTDRIVFRFDARKSFRKRRMDAYHGRDRFSRMRGGPPQQR